jgi:hypothetical protein
MATLKVTNIKNESFAGDQLYLKSDGRLGIGTTSPSTKLQVSSGHINIDSGYSFQWGDSHERIEQSDGKIEFFTGNSEKMTLSSDYLGIGTSSPQSLIHTFSGSSSGGLFMASNGCNAYIWAIQNAGNLINGSTAGSMGIRSANGFDFSGNNGTAVQLRMDSSGQFALGRTTQITGNGNSSTSVFEQLSNNNYPLALHSAQTNKRGLMIFYATTGAGNAGDPFIVCTDNTNNKFLVTSDGNTSIRGNLVLKTSGKGITAHGADNSTYGELAIKVAAADDSGSNNVATFKRGSNSVINLAFPSGGGIDFSATADGSGASDVNEILDDYEKGTWNPDIETSNSNWSGGVNVSNGNYVKVGSLVYVFGRVSWSSTGGTGNIQIIGIPFSMANGSDFDGQISIGYRENVGYPRLHTSFSTTANRINLHYVDASTPYNSASVVVGALQSTGSLYFAGCYRA